jgi:predicted HicB family RNase H-like nuclease
VIDLREEQRQNASESMRVNSESISNEIDESEQQFEKQFEHRICT